MKKIIPLLTICALLALTARGQAKTVGNGKSDVQESVLANTSVEVRVEAQERQDAAVQDEANMPEESQSMRIKITVGERVLYADFEDNSSTRALIEQMPLTLPMMNLYGREMCYRMGNGALPAEEARDASYEIGDISYWPPAGSLVILYQQNGEVFEQQPIGHISEGVDFFEGMETTDITFDITE